MKYTDLNIEDRQDIQRRVQSETGKDLQIIEKDWWVVAVLRALFELPYAQHISFKGGTSLGLDSVDMWIGEFDHSIEALDLNGESKIDYIIGGHTGYLNTWEFENWVYTCLQELRENGEEALYANPIGQNTIVVKDGAVLTEEEKAAQFKDGTPVPAISDEEVTHVASINVRLPQPEQ